jgi:hypothetical protein
MYLSTSSSQRLQTILEACILYLFNIGGEGVGSSFRYKGLGNLRRSIRSEEGRTQKGSTVGVDSCVSIFFMCTED